MLWQDWANFYYFYCLSRLILLVSLFGKLVDNCRWYYLIWQKAVAAIYTV